MEVPWAKDVFFLTIDRVNPELQDLRPTPNLEKWTDAHEK
jgi:hypothetical protein